MKNFISFSFEEGHKIKLQQTYDDDLSCYYRYKQICTSTLGVRSNVGKESLSFQEEETPGTLKIQYVSRNPTNFDGG